MPYENDEHKYAIYNMNGEGEYEMKKTGLIFFVIFLLGTLLFRNIKQNVILNNVSDLHIALNKVSYVASGTKCISEDNVMKKKTIIIVIISIFLLIAAISFIKQIKSGTSYLNTIKLNWNISLPNNCKEIYHVDSGASFHGDGERYHVFRYDADITLDAPISKLKASVYDRESVLNILSKLKAEKEFYPDFDSITHGVVLKQNDTSTLYLYYSTLQRILYVTEDFY